MLYVLARLCRRVISSADIGADSRPNGLGLEEFLLRKAKRMGMEFLAAQGMGGTVLCHEIAWRDPFDAARRLAERPGFAFLDSALPHASLGRYSYIGIEPFGIFASVAGLTTWNGAPLTEPPLEALRSLLAQFTFEPAPAGLPPFRGGAIGAIPYDFGWRLDGLELRGRPHPEGRDPLHFSFYDSVLAFDHAQQRAFVFSSGFPESDLLKRQARAVQRLDDMLAALEKTPAPAPSLPAIDGWTSNFTQPAYHAAVEQVRTHILDGDIYQANISQRFTANLPEGFSPFAFYTALRAANPAPFAAYLTCGDIIIASSSPELLLRKRGGDIETRPIKGTIARSPDETEDALRRETLLASEKDRAENIMIVDLLRNDLSRVSEPFSVEVPVLCGLESYAGVHHLVSVVTGHLSEGKDALDLIATCFPGGSITGAPKRRAMQIIAAIEQIPRGYYCGAIGYLGFDGAMDLNIAIRTAVMKDGEVQIQAGGGITRLSEPEAEYDETFAKVKRLFAAFAEGKSQ
jgi:para-aminobenzoate synthetase component I